MMTMVFQEEPYQELTKAVVITSIIREGPEYMMPGPQEVTTPTPVLYKVTVAPQ